MSGEVIDFYDNAAGYTPICCRPGGRCCPPCGMEIYTPSYVEELRKSHAGNEKHHTCNLREGHQQWHVCDCGTLWCDDPEGDE
jgi:L-lactate utilization protein LutB